MYLKRIEIQGFKSFANPMIMDFDEGIMGIVGPNGSGKSNVADAVRWVLGEQSAKALRGSNMQDVIFAGTQNRRSQGFAYAALTMDNRDHTLDIDFDEVTVSRRLYRSGESEYRINDTICRMKDVHELFYDTGIGREGYSIIGQGQVDAVLSGKPEDRREVFDEAAGIVKYKRRRNIAQKKFDEGKQNLLRITDICSELERRVGPLKEQSEKAKEYLALYEQLKKAEVGSFVLEYGELDERLAALSEDTAAVSAQLTEAREKTASCREQYEQLSKEGGKLEEQLALLADELSKAALEKETQDNQALLLAEQIRSIEVNNETLKERAGAIAGECENKRSELAGYTKEKTELNRQLDAADDKVEK